MGKVGLWYCFLCGSRFNDDDDFNGEDMAEAFIGEIKLVPYNFAPLGWAFCYGQLMAISENDALFALIGTTYGGDGQSTFALPDLRGRTPIHQSGQNPLGQAFGVESVTLISQEMPSHGHMLHVAATAGTQSDPTNAFLGAGGSRTLGKPYTTTLDGTTMNSASVSFTGMNMAHDNMQPFLTMHYIICLQGIFPSQN